MLSPYSKDIKNKFNINTGNVNKWIPTLYDKERYVLHYENLKLYHRVLQFEQSNWLKPYIDFNNTKIANAKNTFEKYFLKLLNDSVFGKTMENLRKRCSVKLINNQNDLIKYVAKPTFISSKIFHENLVAINKIK